MKVLMASAGEGFVTWMGDWAELPSDLLTLIAKRTHSYEDFVAFGGVCRSWRSVAVKKNFNHSAAQRQIPWLMIAEENGQNQRSFVSLTKGGMVRRVELPGARSWVCCISSKGWLITSNEADEMALVHPLTGVHICLPHPKTFKNYMYTLDLSNRRLLDRAALSASPSETEDYVIMVILKGFNVAFWKPGNNIWTAIKTKPYEYCEDVVYYKDQFYAINRGGELILLNMCSGTSHDVGLYAPVIAYDRLKDYLVECGGELLLLAGGVRHHFSFHGQPPDNYYVQDDITFRVFKFDMTDFNEWQEINDFGESSIFVGSGATAVAASDAAGTKSNCIYYADGYANQYVTLYPIREEGTGMYKWEGQTRKVLAKDVTSGNIWVSPSF